LYGRGTASGIWERGGALMPTRLFREEIFSVQQRATVGRPSWVGNSNPLRRGRMTSGTDDNGKGSEGTVRNTVT